MKKPPAAPPAYRPQPTPRVLQTKKDPLRNATLKTVQPAKKKAAPLAYKPNPTPRVLQTKMRDNHLPRPSASAVRTRASVVQRMEQKFPYSAASISKSEPQSNASTWTFTGKNGESLVIKDNGAKLSVYANGKDVGYMTYIEENEEGQRRMRLCYIHITNQAWQGKKLSAGLVFILCLKALQKGINVICIGHPDAGKKDYWEAMGIDYKGAQVKQYAINSKAQYEIPDDVPEEYRARTLAPVEETVPTEADGPVGAVLGWAQKSFFSYWQ